MEATGFISHGPVVARTTSTSLGAHFLKRLQEHGERVAIVQEVAGVEVSTTYAALLRQAKAVTCLLREYGIGVGGTVMLCCGNRPEFVPILLGTWFAGAALAPVNPAYDATDMEHLLGVTAPQLVITDAQSDRCIRAALTGHGQPDVPCITLASVTARLTEDVTAGFSVATVEDAVDHVAFVLCSSGTSGKPKGVETSGATILLRLATLGMLPASALSDQQLVTLNMSGPYWVSCQLMTLFSLDKGAKLVLMETFTAHQFFSVIQQHKINVVMVGPDQLVTLAKQSSTTQFDLSSLRAVLYGGATMSETMLQRAQSNLRHKVTVLYGLTECIGIFTPAFLVAGKLRTCGTPSANVQAKVVDIETGKALGANAEGELCVRSSALFRGYRGNPEATADMYDADGFLHTGDIAYYDEQGCFFVVDRLKELFKYGGIHVPAGDIEEVLLSHPNVREAAVVGIYDQVDCAHATAFVVAREGSTLTSKELQQLVEGTLPSYKWLHGGVRFLDSLPKTASGKIQKYLLRKM